MHLFFMDILLLILLFSNRLTYSVDIRPIFQQRCIQCHNSGPLNWMEYENAFRYKDQIRDRVWNNRSMPPGGFITEQERLLIRNWVDQGANR